jgi:hypothetical protein
MHAISDYGQPTRGTPPAWLLGDKVHFLTVDEWRVVEILLGHSVGSFKHGIEPSVLFLVQVT